MPSHERQPTDSRPPAPADARDGETAVADNAPPDHDGVVPDAVRDKHEGDSPEDRAPEAATAKPPGMRRPIPPRVPPPPATASPPRTASGRFPALEGAGRTAHNLGAPRRSTLAETASDRKPRMPSRSAGPQFVRTPRPEDQAAAEAGTPTVASPGPDTPIEDFRRGLPVPGMIRDEIPLKAKEFRRTRQQGHTPPPPPPAGVLPEAGVAPPERTGTPGAVVREDTGVLIAAVASELIGARSGAEAVAGPRPTGAGLTSGMAPAIPAATAEAAAHDSRAGRRWARVALLAIGLGGILWLSTRETAQAPPAPTANVLAQAGDRAEPLAEAARPDHEHQGAAIAVPPPHEPAEPTPAATVLISETGDEDRPSDDGTGDGDAATGGAHPAETIAEVPPPAEPDPSAAATPKSKPTGKSRSRSRAGTKRNRKSQSTSRSPAPTPSPKATPTKPKPAPPAGDAASLLADARRAYSAGNAGKAYRLAKQSNALKKSTAATETMALASCQRKDEKTAYALMKRLPLSRRRSVRDRCRTYGIRLGL